VDKKIEEEFEARRKMPVEMKRDALKEIIQNLIMVIIILVALSLICFLDEKLIKETFSTSLKVISTIFAIVSIVFFEISYRKEKIRIFFWAIEFFILGTILMFVPYLNQYFQKIILGIAGGFGIYYLMKLVMIILKKRKEFADKKSDIKQLVKDDKSGYLDDVSKKKFGKSKE